MKIYYESESRVARPLFFFRYFSLKEKQPSGYAELWIRENENNISAQKINNDYIFEVKMAGGEDSLKNFVLMTVLAQGRCDWIVVSTISSVVSFHLHSSILAQSCSAIS